MQQALITPVPRGRSAACRRTTRPSGAESSADNGLRARRRRDLARQITRSDVSCGRDHRACQADAGGATSEDRAINATGDGHHDRLRGPDLATASQDLNAARRRHGPHFFRRRGTPRCSGAAPSSTEGRSHTRWSGRMHATRCAIRRVTTGVDARRTALKRADPGRPGRGHTATPVSLSGARRSPRSDDGLRRIRRPGVCRPSLRRQVVSPGQFESTAPP